MDVSGGYDQILRQVSAQVFVLAWTCVQHSKSGEKLYNDSIVFI